MQQDINKIKEAYEKTFEGSPLFGCWFEAKEDVWNFIEQNLKKAYKAGQDDKQLESIRMVSKEFLATLKDPNDDDAKFILDQMRKQGYKEGLEAMLMEERKLNMVSSEDEKFHYIESSGFNQCCALQRTRYNNLNRDKD